MIRRHDAMRRHARHYIGVSSIIAERFEHDQNSYLDILARLDREMRQIDAAWLWLSQQRNDDELEILWVKAQRALEMIELLVATTSESRNGEGTLTPLLQLLPHLVRLTDRALAQAKLSSVGARYLSNEQAELCMTELTERRNKKFTLSEERAVRLCSTSGYLSQRIGDYLRAQHYFECSLAIREQVLGIEHPDTIGSINSLAFLLQIRGDYREAELLYRRAIAASDGFLGENHPTTAWSLHNLGQLILKSDLNQAGHLFARSLAILEQAREQNDAQIALVLHSLGSLSRARRDLDAAADYYSRAARLSEASLGLVHRTTAWHLYRLGEVLQELGDLTGAQSCFEQSLTIREQVFGDLHGRTGKSLYKLADLLYRMGEYSTASIYYKRLLTTLQSRPGPISSRVPFIQERLAEVETLAKSRAGHDVSQQFVPKGKRQL